MEGHRKDQLKYLRTISTSITNKETLKRPNFQFGERKKKEGYESLKKKKKKNISISISKYKKVLKMADKNYSATNPANPRVNNHLPVSS